MIAPENCDACAWAGYPWALCTLHRAQAMAGPLHFERGTPEVAKRPLRNAVRRFRRAIRKVESC